MVDGGSNSEPVTVVFHKRGQCFARIAQLQHLQNDASHDNPKAEHAAPLHVCA
jgi:hypothetical protein